MSQLKGLRDALPGYGFAGVGSADGAAKGEFVPIFYRQQRFMLVDKGHFWLSDRPEEVGSVSWGDTCPHAATWVRLRFSDAPLRTVQVVNVHLDSTVARARLESAKLIRKLADSAGGRPLIVLGDFNCPCGSEPYRVLTKDRRNLAELHDAHGGAGFDGGNQKFAAVVDLRSALGRSSWIMHNRAFEALTPEPAAVENPPRGCECGLVSVTLRMARTGYT